MSASILVFLLGVVMVRGHDPVKEIPAAISTEKPYCNEGDALTNADGSLYNCGKLQKCPPGYSCNTHPIYDWAICCPSVSDKPTCKIGVPLTNDDGTLYDCGKLGLRCPPGYECNIHHLDQWAVCCASDICNLEPDAGPCEAYFPYWYYDSASGECKIFYYGGCLGNANKFSTKESCERTCDPCLMPLDPGPCKGSFARWYYDSADGKCKPFIYGGCLGNANNFITKEECERKCEPDQCDMQCCPQRQFIECPGEDMCANNTDCPDDTICCTAICGSKSSCVKPRPCCCPWKAVSSKNELANLQKCRDDRDCNGFQQKCCISGIEGDNGLYCRESITCPCQDEPLCCPMSSMVSVKPNPKCQWCKQDSVCGPNKKCCLDAKGCSTCTQAVYCPDN